MQILDEEAVVKVKEIVRQWKKDILIYVPRESKTDTRLVALGTRRDGK